jgi:sulfur-carrier protein
VLVRCSFLCDGVAVRDRAQPLRPGTTIDVLPPFAGG